MDWDQPQPSSRKRNIKEVVNYYIKNLKLHFRVTAVGPEILQKNHMIANKKTTLRIYFTSHS